MGGGLSLYTETATVISNVSPGFHTIAFSNASPNQNASFGWVGFPSKQAYTPPVYVMEITFQTSAIYSTARELQENIALQGIVSELSQMGLNVCYVPIDSQLPGNLLGSDGIHPTALGYTNIATVLTGCIRNNLALMHSFP